MPSATVAPLPATATGTADSLPAAAGASLCSVVGLQPCTDAQRTLQRLGVAAPPLDLAALLGEHLRPSAPPPLMELTASQGRGVWSVDTLSVTVACPSPCFPGDALRGAVTLTAACDLELESLEVTLECHQYQSHRSVT